MSDLGLLCLPMSVYVKLGVYGLIHSRENMLSEFLLTVLFLVSCQFDHKLKTIET